MADLSAKEASSLSVRELLIEANKGEPVAARFLGLFYKRGTDRVEISKNPLKAVYWLEKAAILGDRLSLSEIIIYYTYGSLYHDEILNKNLKPSLDYLELCKLLTHDSFVDNLSGYTGDNLFRLSECYLYGLVVEKDIVQGISLLIIAAKSGKSSHSAELIANIYQEGLFGVEQDINKAIKWKTIRLENQRLENEYRKCVGSEAFLGLGKNDSSDNSEVLRCFELVYIYS